MPNKKLYPGVGAKGTIMTRFIKPKNSFRGKDKDHRSVVVLKEHYFEGRKLFFRFTVDEDDDRTFYASSRMVRIDAEGKVEDFFLEADKNRRHIENAKTTLKQQKESTIKWKNSKARQLLYQDIMDGNVALEEGDETKSLEEIFSMHIEYAEYDFKKFKGRLQSLRQTIVESNHRAAIDQRAFDNFIETYPVSYQIALYG
ncbi:hypothetical protein IV203_032945 [Nitzschia inconspicua]|uniref:Uncharacterized protein n=1 Tax=Nitzschia inconspicua TaxID=303405 RepID=A0A9K3KLN0_9STRA|nr:hypothetical protein IV203_032945 [Nitzschia inconspicua]